MPKAISKSPPQVVAEVLGVRPLARHLKIYPSTVSRWILKGCVPSKYHKPILELAGAKLTADDLIYGRKASE